MFSKVVSTLLEILACGNRRRFRICCE